MNTDYYYMKNIRQYDIVYLSTKNIVCHPVVDVTILDYGKYIQVDRVIHGKKKKCKKEVYVTGY